MGEKGRHPVVDRYVRPSVRPCRPVGVFIYVLIIVCVRVCLCVCVFVCLYVYVHCCATLNSYARSNIGRMYVNSVCICSVHVCALVSMWLRAYICCDKMFQRFRL